MVVELSWNWWHNGTIVKNFDTQLAVQGHSRQEWPTVGRTCRERRIVPDLQELNLVSCMSTLEQFDCISIETIIPKSRKWLYKSNLRIHVVFQAKCYKDRYPGNLIQLRSNWRYKFLGIRRARGPTIPKRFLQKIGPPILRVAKRVSNSNYRAAR